MNQLSPQSSLTTLGYARAASTGAFSTLLLFLLCWAGVALGLRSVLPHAFVNLFTLEPAGTAASLGVGGIFAFLSGGVGGVIIAHCYNLAGRWIGD